MATGDTEAAHASGFGSPDSDETVLEDETIRGRNVQSLGSGEENIGIRFTARDGFTADDLSEVLPDAKCFQTIIYR